jgi:N-methylhydantoinase A
MTFSPLLRLAVDIGGTFTDTVLVEGADHILASNKVLTTHDNPANGAMLGARQALDQAGCQMSDLTGFVHGTTLATNALIERRGAKVATISTYGFRDILEIAYERRYSQYDITLQKTDFLVPRERSFTVSERVAASGQVLVPLDEAAINELVANLKESGANAVAICLINSYANGVHEQRLRDLLRAACPNLVITLSGEVSPEAREFDRMCTAVANAYIQPLMSGYLSSFADQFAAEGLTCPILMMTAGGGMTTLETAARFPIRLVESGPAGGAILAARIARENDLDEVLSFDMGGTTAKLCLIDKGRPQNARQFEIARAARFIKGSGMPVRIPVIEMIEIGAGGGSIASVDRLGRLTVGPHSAGSEPGPAAFGRGGTQPTVTDADVGLGYIRRETFGDGQFRLDTDGANAALARLGAEMDTDAAEAADGISRIVDESMASAGRMHAVESGKDLGARTMIAFGGNGPLHACRVARSAGVTRVLIPPDPGVGSAVGFVYAPVSFEVVRSRYTRLTVADFTAVNAMLVDMIAEAKVVVHLGAPRAGSITRRSAFMRYSGQGHEIEVELPNRDLADADLPALTAAFDQDYARQFSRPVPGMEIEILNWSVQVATRVEDQTNDSAPTPVRRRKAAQTVRITCDLDGTNKAAALIARDDMQPGDHLSGPALITETQTTTFVGADFDVRVDGRRNLVLTRITPEAQQ